MSTIRLPPNAVRSATIPSGSARISPTTVASAPPGQARSAATAASVSSGDTIATNLPSFATYNGSMPSRSHAPTTAGRIGSDASSRITARPGTTHGAGAEPGRAKRTSRF